MHLYKNNLQIQRKISIVRKQINEIKAKYHSQKILSREKYNPYMNLSEKVYYDQLEELNSILNKLKLKKTELDNDVLENWCEDNPCEIECKIYDL